MNIEVVKYSSRFKAIWDSFVALSKNGTFLFYRNYMEYHEHKFSDNSLLFFLKDRLIALLPAHRSADELCSHNGLTYGGLIFSSYTKAEHVIAVFQELLHYMNKTKIRSLIYKAIPYIYHKEPSQEDLYSLFINGAVLINTSVSSCLYLDTTPSMSRLRKRCLSKSLKYDLLVSEDIDFTSFWNLLEANLYERYNVSPVHTLNEISALQYRFPENIKLYTVILNSRTIGGCVVYFSDKVAHIQYIASSKIARDIGAIDFLLNKIISLLSNRGIILDFGTSMLEDHISINKDLISQKEGFGARTIVYNTYLLTPKN